MGQAYSPREAAGKASAAGTPARLSVIARDPFKEKAERDVARRAARDGFKQQTALPVIRHESAEKASHGRPALHVVASGETLRTDKRNLRKKSPLVLITSSGGAVGDPTVTEAEYTELPKEPE